MTTDSSSQKRLRTTLFYGIVLILAYLVFLIFRPFLVPLAWAVVLVVVSYPVYESLARRWGPTTASIAATAGVTVILIVPALLVMGGFVRQGVDAARSIQEGIANGRFEWVNRAWLDLQARFAGSNSVDLPTLLHRYAEMAAGFVAEKLGTILRHMAEFVFHLCVTILAMFYLFREGHSIMARLREVLPFEDTHRERILREGHDLIFASVTSSLVAAAAHGVLGGFAFALTGIQAPIFWGVMMGFFSLVPVVGSALIWVPAAISLMLQGHVVRGIILAVICGLIVGLVDNFVRPWLISGHAKLSELVVFISILGGISVFGVLGVILGPIIVATAITLLEIYSPGGAPPRTSASKGKA